MGERSVGRPKKRWLEEAKKELSQNKIINYKLTTRDWQVWRERSKSFTDCRTIVYACTIILIDKIKILIKIVKKKDLCYIRGSDD